MWLDERKLVMRSYTIRFEIRFLTDDTKSVRYRTDEKTLEAADEIAAINILLKGFADSCSKVIAILKISEDKWVSSIFKTAQSPLG
jgi:uncharacterized beta-barrel protein YwiB (DUF1934 family)